MANAVKNKEAGNVVAFDPEFEREKNIRKQYERR